MRQISSKLITEEVKKLVIDASHFLPADVRKRLEELRAEEDWDLAKSTLDQIIKNADIAENDRVPMCQDTGMAVVFVKIGQEVEIVDGYITDAINEGVRLGYVEGLLRKSVVEDPLYDRINTKDNTPAVIHYDIVPGDKLNIMIAAKGFGSENMSRLKMLKPSDGVEGVKDFVMETVELAGPNPCPPIVVGVGIGGTMDKATILAKEALMRDMDSENPKPEYKALEEELLEMINKSGIGPQGYGGKSTCLRVLIKSYPTHIAGLPVAVNINCHATRHKEIEL
ncbi:fumarate hydratase [Microaceticoccus formicicus]|uniref:fumarate hydratase n=1 Tax=Microaceticoccus formicicus TaxID=3118105 RepID=UPI003CD0221D|nr:fumarate hydratase [Peptoniphilaceae bacterium AMB_02]